MKLEQCAHNVQLGCKEFDLADKYLAKSLPTPSPWSCLGIFAYKEGLSCLDVLLSNNLILEAGFDWREDMPLCIAFGCYFCFGGPIGVRAHATQAFVHMHTCMRAQS